MIERLIENWLTSSNERGYEVPFCQLLMAEGYRVIHLNRHSPTEQGKDVIAVNPSSRLCAYQLKAGDIDLRRWRNEIAPEIVALIEQVVEHPGVNSGFAIPYLVTNGRLKEPVVQEINTLNRSNRKRGFEPLTVIVGTDLTSRFVDCHGQFFPQEPRDLDTFLRLFLADGKDMLPKARFARFLEGQLDLDRCARRTEVGRAIASTVILAAYALGSYQRAENHYAVFEGWILTASYIARLAEAKAAAQKEWRDSLQLVLNAARLAMSSLVEEALSRSHPTEGDPLTDGGPVYRARLTILLGIAAAHTVLSDIEGRSSTTWPDLSAFMKTHDRHMLLWGESAVPFFTSLALCLERTGRSYDAEEIVARLIRSVCSRNSPRSRNGLPNPYYGVGKVVAALCGVGRSFAARDNPSGDSFTLAALVDFLVRRWRKQTLKALWEGVTHIHLTEMQYACTHDFYRWRTFNQGNLTQWYVQRPQPWDSLASEAQAPPSNAIPRSLREDPRFAVMFALVYPHRFCRDLLKLVEAAYGTRSTEALPIGESGTQRAKR